MAKDLKDIDALATAAGGDRTKFESLVGKKITVTGVEWSEGEFGDYALMSFTIGNSKKIEVTSTGGEQITRVLKAADKEDLFPFNATVKKFASKKFKGKFAYSLE